MNLLELAVVYYQHVKSTWLFNVMEESSISRMSFTLLLTRFYSHLLLFSANIVKHDHLEEGVDILVRKLSDYLSSNLDCIV